MISTSLVIPSYQGARRLDVLLDALSRQDAEFDWEAIVVLDGSTDASAEVVDRWRESVPVRLVDLGTNQGRSAALNAGFDAAVGNVLVRCDDDLVPRPDYVRRHTEHHQDGADRGVIGLYANVLPDTTYARLYGQRADRAFRDSASSTAVDQQWHFWAGNCSTTRALYDRVGPYDTSFRAYGWEDVDWGLRLHRIGASIFIDDALTTPHLVAATTTVIRTNRAYQSGRAKKKFLTKHGLVEPPAPSHTPKERSWNAMVGILAHRRQSTRERLARAIDDRGRSLPPSIGYRLVALAVESAGRAGLEEGPSPEPRPSAAR